MLLSATIDMILPSGKMSVFVRSIVAIFVFCTIIAPITKLAKSQDIITDIVNTIDEQYIVNIADKQVETTKERIKKSIKSNYGLSSDVEIEYINEKGVASISKINITIENNENFLNTNEIEGIKASIITICGTNVEVNIYER